MHTSNFWHKFSKLSPGVTLKIRWRSPKHNQLIIMSECFMHEYLVKIRQSVDILQTSTFWLKSGSLSPAVTLKIRSRSPKPNQLFIMSQYYIHTNLAKIWQPVHEKVCKQKSVTPTPMLTPTPSGSAPTTICPPSLSVGTCFMLKTWWQQTLKNWIWWQSLVLYKL